jgi:hypothetical protein
VTHLQHYPETYLPRWDDPIQLLVRQGFGGLERADAHLMVASAAPSQNGARGCRTPGIVGSTSRHGKPEIWPHGRIMGKRLLLRASMSVTLRGPVATDAPWSEEWSAGNTSAASRQFRQQTHSMEKSTAVGGSCWMS